MSPKKPKLMMPGPGGTLMMGKLKKARRPKKNKLAEAGGEQFRLSSGITPLPASLLSISTPLPPVSGQSPVKDSDPPPLPIRIPFVTSSAALSPSSPTPRVIHYAAPRSETLVTNNPTTPTWTVAVSRPMTAARPAAMTAVRPAAGAQHVILSSQPRPQLAPGQIQLPPAAAASMIRQSAHSPDKLLILMSPNKDGAAAVSPTKDGGAGGLVVSPTKILLPQQGSASEGLVIAKTGGLVLTSSSPTKQLSQPSSPVKQTVLQKPVDETQLSPASSPTKQLSQPSSTK